MKGTYANKETAYRAYQESGRDIPETLMLLNEKHGLHISERTLHRWKREGRWDSQEGGLFLGGELLGRIIRLIERMEGEIENAGRVDPQSVYSLLSLARFAVGLSEKYQMKTPFDKKAWKRKAEEILEQEYGIKRG